MTPSSNNVSMRDITAILTHPGGAHKDDFLACSILIAQSPVEILRREPTPDALDDPKIAVVDIGHRHDPETLCFDHHQLDPKEHLTCALSLVLDYLGIYSSARRYCDWLETAEWFDCRGPNKTADWLGTDRDILARLSSPIDVTLLRRFAASEIHHRGEPVWEIMRMIGTDLLDYIETMDQKVAALAPIIEAWPMEHPEYPDHQVVFIPRQQPSVDDPAQGISFVLQDLGIEKKVAVIISPDSRGAGYGLKRFDDHPACDFRQIEDQDDVTFAHKGGFIAKTTATDVERLKKLIKIART